MMVRQPVMVEIKKSYRALKPSDIQFDEDGRAYVLCPRCGSKLIVVQHPTTNDGLPFVQCGADCPDQDPIVIVE